MVSSRFAECGLIGKEKSKNAGYREKGIREGGR